MTTEKAGTWFALMRAAANGVAIDLPQTTEAPLTKAVQPKSQERKKNRKPLRAAWGAGAALPNGDLDD